MEDEVKGQRSYEAHLRLGLNTRGQHSVAYLFIGHHGDPANNNVYLLHWYILHAMTCYIYMLMLYTCRQAISHMLRASAA